MAIAPTLNVPQAKFLAMQYKFKAYVAGFGSGKTWVGCGGICKGMWEHPKINQGYFAPTYPQIRDIFYPTVEEVAHDWGLNVKINEGNKEVHFYAGRQYRGTTICRSMEKPQTIVGFKIGNALIDELDVMPAKKAQLAWRKIIARMRYNVPGLRNGIDVTTTPEGFKFVYQQFAKAVRDKPSLLTLYGLVQASTFDNEKNLPPDYIPSLMESYPPELIKAYLRGQFTNLTSGTIYHQFDRKLNNCREEEQPGEPLYIGMDFNVGKMAGIVHVLRLGLPFAVNEIVKAYDTPDMIRIIKERFWLYDGNDYRKVREIYIYPDASGDSRKSSNASATDIAQLKQAGFNVVVNASNPPVKDRINSMNAMFCNGNGERVMTADTSAKLDSTLENLRKNGLDATLSKPGFGTGVQNVSSDNSQRTTVHAPITQEFNLQGVTPEQLNSTLNQNNRQLSKQLKGELTKEVMMPQGDFGRALKSRYVRGYKE